MNKLLTFMNDSDKNKVILMYNRLFDDAIDEDRLVSLLVSPTRQAVFLARAYNNQNRTDDLRVLAGVVGSETGSKEQEYIKAVRHIREEAANRGIIVRRVPPTVKVRVTTGPAAAKQPRTPAEEAFAGEAALELKPEEIIKTGLQRGEEMMQSSAAAADNTAPADEAYYADTDLEEGISEAESHILDLINGINASMAAIGKTVADGNAPENSDYSEDAYAGEYESGDEDFAYDDEDNDDGPELKLNAGLLILYLLFAIPAVLIGTVIILIPATIVLVLTVAFVVAGIFLVNAALSGITILADVLILFGGAFAVLALGLLFAWIFVWTIGSVIPRFIRSIVRLGRKICCREVKE